MPDPDTSRVPWERFVRLAFRGVLAREVTTEELESHRQRLESREVGPDDLLAELMARPESTRARATSTYRFDADQRYQPFRTPEIDAMSSQLRARPLDRGDFDALWRVRFDQELARGEAEDRLRDYGEMHRDRFWETANAMTLLLDGVDKPRLLDFGISAFSWFYRRMFEGLELVTVDRPAGPAIQNLFAEHSRAVGAAAHVVVDLEDPSSWTDELDAQLGDFDLILFTEVLEHLLVNPVQVLSLILRRLRPDGWLYLTTPNFFSLSALDKVAARVNPQQVFPENHAERTKMHQREFGMAELLAFITEAGGAVRGFEFSGCWDEEEVEPPDQRSNLVVVAQRR